MDWTALPSLASLRAFEVASRHLGFSAAARELNVTHAAIAQQVRALEADLGVALLLREGRGLALTEDGQRLAQGLSEGFAAIAGAVDVLRQDRGARPLRVTMTQAFAKNWLVPRLGGFWDQHPDIAVTLLPEDGLDDLVRDGIDVAIRFGAGTWPGVGAQMLVPAAYVVAGAPHLVGDGLTIAQMATMRWVLKEDWPEQHLWLASIGLESDRLIRQSIATTPLAEVAMEKGLGLSVTLGPLVADAVANGRIRIAYSQQAAGTTDEAGQQLGYYIVTRNAPHTAALRSFVRWLKSHG